MKLSIVAGTRPNFIKIAPIIAALDNANTRGQQFDYRLVHTGQHYDDKLSRIFFTELNIPEPHINLNCGSGTQAEQTGKIMIEYERELMRNPCDMVIVVGDVNSTMACTIVAKKLNIRVAHVEGGIRSFDLGMPEEINRMVTDSIADYFFTTSAFANENLKKAGIGGDRIFFVGNTMIDTLLRQLPNIKRPEVASTLGLGPSGYFVLTLHRPSNVDDPVKFKKLIERINSEATLPVIFPVHPRTRKNFEKVEAELSNIVLTDPLSYLEFIYLVKHAKGVITDSGGIQEETTVLGVPCITLRNNTERPETVSTGTNEMIGEDLESMAAALKKINAGKWKQGAIPELWDGNTAERIVAHLAGL